MNEKQMTVQEAMTVIAQACAEFKGTLRDHQVIQQALQKVQDTIDGKREPAAGVEGEK